MTDTSQVLDLEGELAIVCDESGSHLRDFTAKFHAFADTLTADERAYLMFIRRAADVAAAEHGRELLDDIDQFEARIEAVLGESYSAPEMGGIVIRTTVVTRCATWLLRC